MQWWRKNKPLILYHISELIYSLKHQRTRRRKEKIRMQKKKKKKKKVKTLWPQGMLHLKAPNLLNFVNTFSAPRLICGDAQTQMLMIMEFKLLHYNRLKSKESRGAITQLLQKKKSKVRKKTVRNAIQVILFLDLIS